MNYNDVIEYIDGTYDENFEAAKKWAKEHGTTFEEDLSKRELPKRYFVIGGEPEPIPEPEPEVPHEPTREEVEANRAFLYKELVDPITSHIQRLRDEEVMTAEINAEIEELKTLRTEKIVAIKERCPYPAEETAEEETKAEPLELYSMEI